MKTERELLLSGERAVRWVGGCFESDRGHRIVADEVDAVRSRFSDKIAQHKRDKSGEMFDMLENLWLEVIPNSVRARNDIRELLDSIMALSSEELGGGE
jgi:hypothetical protein